jgi:alginate O-acetyltransferase complex protein AlgI
MLFPTIEFFIFFIIVFYIRWGLVNHLKLRNLFLILSSLFFYGFWDYRFVGLILFSSVLNYGMLYCIYHSKQQKMKKLYLIISCFLNLSVLIFFKYYTFLLLSLDGLLFSFQISLGLPYIQGIILPVGISFFTFQILSLIIDTYQGKIQEFYSLDEIVLYICFFPQLVAGPIVRAENFLPQLKSISHLGSIPANKAFSLIAIGLCKKIIIANYLSVLLVDPIFENPSEYTILSLIVGTYAYSYQIYCDFSAYSDIAIGTALLLGFEFPDNFNSPYLAESIQDFWKRWHISLSSWLKDYLYIPLGGSRAGKISTYRNILITMILGGLWHGASWNFLLWGALHGTMLSLERIFRSFSFSLPRFLKILITFHLVSFCWIFFRAGSWENTQRFFKAIQDGTGELNLINPFVLCILGIGILSHFLPKSWTESLLTFRSPYWRGFVFSIFLLLLGAIAQEGVFPFIYFQF